MSEEYYTKMCKGAKDIQKIWKPNPWDWMYCIKLKTIVILSGYLTDSGVYGHEYNTYREDNIGSAIDVLDEDECCEEGKNNHIWLPTQIQLQKMITPKIVSKYIKYTTFDTSLYWNQLFAITKWLDVLSNNKDHYANIIMTFQAKELWLTFLMYEKFQKKWDVNKKEWIKR